MRWPWTSVARLEDERARSDVAAAAAAKEIEWLRDRVAALEDMIERRNRFQAGMTEVPREKRPEPKPMPAALREHISSWASKSMREQMLRAAFRRHADGEPWESIEADVLAPADSPILQAASVEHGE